MGHVEIGGGIHVDVAVAVTVDHVGDLGVVEDRAHQGRPAPGDEAVDQAGQLHELDRGFVADVLHQDDGVLGQTRLARPLAQEGGDGHVGAQRRRRAPQERGVARLEAQPGGVGGHVGAVLVDDGHHSERHPQPLDLQTIGTAPAVEDLPHRVGEGGDLAQPGGHAGDPVLGEPQAVERTGFHAPGRSRLQIAGVGGEDLTGPLGEQVGRLVQGGILGGGGSGGEEAGGGFGPPPQIGDAHTPTLPLTGWSSSARGTPPPRPPSERLKPYFLLSLMTQKSSWYSSAGNLVRSFVPEMSTWPVRPSNTPVALVIVSPSARLPTMIHPGF